MRVRKKPRHEVIIEDNNVVENILAPKSNTEKSVVNQDFSQDTVTEISNSDIQSLQLKHEEELNQLKEQLAKIEKPTKNEEKILNAIKSERLKQNTQTPTIGRNLFMREYNLRPKYLDKSIQSLLQKSVIKRTFIKYSATQNTSKWEIL